MKDSTDYLPELKRSELATIVDVLRQNCADAQMIILYGSYARGNFKEAKDLPIDEYQSYPPSRLNTARLSDYDILLVTASKDTAIHFYAGDITDKLDHLSAPVHLTAYDIDSLNILLGEGQYFYSDIIKEGILLYDSGNHQLGRRWKLTPSQKQRIAQEYYNDHFARSAGFLLDFSSNMDRQDLKGAAFHLHQAAEHAYRTMLLVFRRYVPKSHWLKELGTRCKRYHPDLAALFPQTTTREKDRFEKLEYAYIGARYDPRYSISKEYLEILALDVKKLITITETVCLDKIKSFGKL